MVDLVVESLDCLGYFADLDLDLTVVLEPLAEVAVVVAVPKVLEVASLNAFALDFDSFEASTVDANDNFIILVILMENII